MNNKLTVDIEGDGFLPNISKVWCICADNYTSGESFAFRPQMLLEGLNLLNSYDTIIGHNFIGYDLPALKKVLGYDYNGNVIDTMILSQLLYPERPKGHSLEAWGQRLGFPKVEHEDWTKFSPEMLDRCRVDVKLTSMVYEALCNEAGEEIVGVPIHSYRF